MFCNIGVRDANRQALPQAHPATEVGLRGDEQVQLYEAMAGRDSILPQGGL